MKSENTLVLLMKIMLMPKKSQSNEMIAIFNDFVQPEGQFPFSSPINSSMIGSKISLPFAGAHG